jgi:hypothetical protein
MRHATISTIAAWTVLIVIALPLTTIGDEARAKSTADTDKPSAENATRTGPAAKKGVERAVGIRFHGLLPGSVNPDLEGKFRIQFRIYRSPQGGEPIWNEEQEVTVKDGKIDVMLGKKKPVPMSIHTATFKFLGASVGGRREVYPRYAIVNVVYVSPKEALTALANKKGATRPKSAPPASKTPAGKYPAVKMLVASKSQKAASWTDALHAARALKGDLPDYEAWYRSLEESEPDNVLTRAGHYEWVLPWVYDPGSHGTYSRYFRGRFEGCDYMDLSPKKSYVYRIATPKRKPSAKKAP